MIRIYSLFSQKQCQITHSKTKHLKWNSPTVKSTSHTFKVGLKKPCRKISLMGGGGKLNGLEQGGTPITTNLGDGVVSSANSGVLSTLFSNPLFSAGFGLLGVGTGLALLRSAWKYILLYGRRNFLISVEIPSRDKSFGWFMEWTSSREGSNTQHVSVETNFTQFENGEINTKIQLVPSTGTHWIKFKGKWIQVERVREKNVVDMTSGNLWESVTLTTIGRSRKIFEEILEEAKTFCTQKEEGTTVIYTSAGGDWRRFGFPRKRRPLNSVILDEGKTDRILKDAQEFLNAGKWYIDRGIPYRRGYLLFGPPGTGKSSFIMALAGRLNLNICIISLQSKGISDDVLNHLLNIAPQRSILLLEDIDVAMQKGMSGVTLSGLLNALDGVAATEGGGRIIFMTTNHIEKLPPVLIRPGRVDVRECLDLATTAQLKGMFRKFFPPLEKSDAHLDVESENERTNDMALKFSTLIPNGMVSMAQLQGFFMRYKESPELALSKAQELLVASDSHLEKKSNIEELHKNSLLS
eukprot:TRINITY_DN7797_c0_g1_i1.p1 TRINITY_DN7797_c0_g1~~TRINITY_DN7797_c0_g1_i1.p1  ORF type:complete len:523 (-),score=103.71 TRINITY_DN7797_c0_g1_i1:60-1628(-)